MFIGGMREFLGYALLTSASVGCSLPMAGHASSSSSLNMKLETDAWPNPNPFASNEKDQFVPCNTTRIVL